MSEILVNTIKKADGTGGLTVPSGSGTVATLAGGTFTGDIVLGTNSLFIGGTGSANELTDYEEGTWTPTYRDSDGTGTAANYAVRWGRYVKIGHLVHLSFEMGDFDFSGGGGNIESAGIPFSHTTADSQGRIFGGSVSLYEHDLSVSGVINLSFRLKTNSHLEIIGTRDNAAWDIVDVENANGLYVAGDITYYSA